MVTYDEIIKYLQEYREKNTITYKGALSETDFAKFAKELNNIIGQMSFEAPYPDAQIIPYTGGLDGVNAWMLAEALSKTSSGKYIYISDIPAGDLLNDYRFEDALIKVTGEKGQSDIILFGKTINGANTPYSTDGVLCLNDLVSKTVMELYGTGNVKPIILEYNSNKVFFRTELPALLENPNVTSIWDIPVSEIKATLNNYLDYGFSSQEQALNCIGDNLDFLYREFGKCISMASNRCTFRNNCCKY